MTRPKNPSASAPKAKEKPPANSHHSSNDAQVGSVSSDDPSFEEFMGATTAQHLRDLGLSLKLLQSAPLKELEERFGISRQAAAMYKKYAMNKRRFQSAYQLLLNRQRQLCFTTGVDNIDELLFVPELGSGGIRTGETYEFAGVARAGKSQLCHQLAITVQLPPKLGGIQRRAIYIDTEGTFSPARILQLLQGFPLWDKNPADVLRDISYARVMNSDDQQQVVEQLPEILESGEYGLVVVDSVTAHFRGEYAGRGTLTERQQALNFHLNSLKRIADGFNVAVVVTNQVLADPSQVFGDPTVPAGGHIMAHWAANRFSLRRSRGMSRMIRVVDSPVLPERETVFSITPEGLISP